MKHETYELNSLVHLYATTGAEKKYDRLLDHSTTSTKYTGQKKIGIKL